MELSKKRSGYLFTFLVLIGLALINFTIQIGVDPSYKNMSTDSGVFAYCGQIIRSGGLMYRDCWDNKPPGVYYLDAAAMSLGGSNPFTVWLFQAIWLTVGLWSYFLILRKVWGRGLAALAAFSLLFILLYPIIFAGGNLTETYAVFPIVLSMGAFWAYLRSGKLRWVVCLGLLLAFGFLLKPTYISLAGSALVVILYLDLCRGEVRSLLAHLGIFSFSALAPIILVFSYWAVQHNFNELWFAVFAHNITYVQSGFSLDSLYGTARMFLASEPMVSLTALVVISFGIFFFQNFRSLLPLRHFSEGEASRWLPGGMSTRQSQVWWQAGIGLALILDVLFLASSGKNFGHYLQVLLPGMVAGSLYFLDLLWNSILENRKKRAWQTVAVLGVLVIFVMGGRKIVQNEKPSLDEIKTFFSTPNLTQYQPNQLEQYIIDHSQPSDSVLIWAGHPSMNFLTNRRSPTRYIFLQHLFTPTPSGQNGFSEFLNELNADPPALIVAQPVSSAGLPYWESATQLVSQGYASDIQAKMLDFKRFMDDRYVLADKIWDWVVYERIR